MIRPSWIELLVSSRMRVIAPIAALAGAAGLGGKQLVSAQSTPAAGDAQALLDRAVSAMQALDSYSFDLETQNGEIELIPEVFTIHDLEGDVVRPDGFQAETEIEVLFVDVDLKIVSLGPDTWITNPLTLVGSDNDMVRIGDIDFDGNFNPAWAVNPDHIALPLLGVIENPSINPAGSTSDVTQIDGVITRDGIDTLGDIFEAATISGFIADSFEQLQASVWIDGDDHVSRFDIIGQIFDREDTDIVRKFFFDDFNERITIERP
jgi:hypothetical protein